MFFKPFKKQSDHLKELYSEKHELEFLCEKDRNPDTRKKADAKIEEIDEFIENEYASAVYDYYLARKPKLVRIKNNETVSWEDAFGNDFNAVSKPLRHSLVGLVEGDGRYKLK